MSSFKQIQQQFAQHIRDPQNTAAPDNIEEKRLSVYRELFFNNVDGFVSSAFPVFKSLFDEQSWLKLVREFFIQHPCETPLFLEISQEFLGYMQQRLEVDKALADELPEFTLELLHYEWVELDVSVRPEINHYKLLDDVSAEQTLVFSETASLLAYQYPVQHISEDFQPDSPGLETTFIIVYRDTDEEVQFVAINALTAHLLNILLESPGLSFAAYLQKIIESLPQMPAESVEQGAMTTIKRMSQIGVIRAS